MSYGITAEGFVRMRLPEIRQEIVADFRARLRARGINAEPETRPDSVLGELIDTFAEREARMWEMAEAVHLSMYPSTAFGASLDRSISFSGATPLTEEPAAAYVVLYGTQGTTVPAGTQLRNSSTQELYALAQDVVITQANAVDVSVVPEVVGGATYTITIGGTSHSYTSAAAPVLQDTIAGLVAALNDSDWTVTSDGAQIRLRTLSSAGESISLSGPLRFSEIGSRALVRTEGSSEETAQAGSIDTIVTTTTGLARVSNPTAGTAGRLREEDFQKRERYRLGVFRLGAGTLPSIAPNIYETVNGVQRLVVRQNDSDGFVGGLLPHSIHVVAEGGLDDEIAAAIYKFKGGGIDTNGATVITLKTPEGDQEIRFDRPTPAYIWVKVSVSLKPESENEPFPATGMEDIRDAIVELGNQLSIGGDVVWQKFFTAIYETQGIEEVTLEFARTASPSAVPAPGDYAAENIPIGPSEVARFDITRTEVL